MALLKKKDDNKYLNISNTEKSSEVLKKVFKSMEWN